MSTTSLKEQLDKIDAVIGQIDSGNPPHYMKRKKVREMIKAFLAQHTAEVRMEARLSDNHDWDAETFKNQNVIACRRCATTYQTICNKPCKGKMAKIGLRQLNSKDEGGEA